MAQILVTPVPHLCYPDYKPFVSCLMDPAVVASGNSYAKSIGVSAVTKKYLVDNSKTIPYGTPYISHNGEDTVGQWTQKIVALPIQNAKVKVLKLNEKIRGNWIEYGNSRVTVRQCHFKSMTVSLGMYLKTGDTIGYEGDSGNVSGKHLHTSIIIDGKYVDPRYYVTGMIPFPLDIEPPKPTPKGESIMDKLLPAKTKDNVSRRIISCGIFMTKDAANELLVDVRNLYPDADIDERKDFSGNTKYEVVAGRFSGSLDAGRKLVKQINAVARFRVHLYDK